MSSAGNGRPMTVGSSEWLGPTRETVVRLARAAGVNGDPAGPGDDGIDMWYGLQYLPNGALTKLVALAMAEEQARWIEALRKSELADSGMCALCDVCAAVGAKWAEQS